MPKRPAKPNPKSSNGANLGFESTLWQATSARLQAAIEANFKRLGLDI